MNGSKGKIFMQIAKWIGYSFGFFLIIILVLLAFIRTEFVQDIIRKKATAYLSGKIGTSVTIGKFRTNLVSHLELQSVTIRDKSDRELLHIGNLQADFNLFALLNNTLSIRELGIDTLNFKIARTENDSTFNFDYILKAFSGPPSTKAIDTLGKPMNFDVGKLSIKQLHFLMDDSYGNQFYDLKSSIVALNIEKIDLENQLYKIKSFETEGLTAKMDIGTSKRETSSGESSGRLPQVIIDKIALAHSNFSLRMPGAGFTSETKIENFLADMLNLDLNSNKVDFKQLMIDQHQSQVFIQTPDRNFTEAKTDSSNLTVSKLFIVHIGSIALKNNDLKYDNGSAEYNPVHSFNANHINLKSIQLDLSQFSMAGSTFGGNINKFQAKEQSGLEIRKLSTGFLYADTAVWLDHFLLNTASSDINGNFRISYESLAAISKNPGQLGFDVNLKKMLLSSQDLKFFRGMAGNNPNINKLLANNIYLEGKMKGQVADMTIENLKLRTDQIRFSATGKIAGLPDANQLKGNINLKEFSGTTKSLARLLPEGSIPPTIAANESFDLKGKLSVNENTYSFDLTMNSTAGNVTLKGEAKQLQGVGKLSYNLFAQSDGLLLDRILMDTLYGNTVFDVQLKGKGISPETAESQLHAEIPTIHFKGYDYKTINLNAAISASVVDADFRIQDSAFNSNFTATYSLDSLHPIAKANAHINNLKLQRLGFMADTLSFKGDLVADLTTINSKHINGTVRIPHIEITKDAGIYKLDSISLDAENRDSLQNIAIKSSFLDMSLNGYYEIDALSALAQNLLIDYLTVYPLTGTVFKPAFARLKGELRPNPVITAFIPGFKPMKTIKFGSVVGTRKKDLMFALSVPSAVYNNVIIDSTLFGFHTANDTLQYALYSSGIKNPAFTLEHSYIEGKAKNGNIDWLIQLYNRAGSLKYNLSGKIVTDTTKFVLHLYENQAINGENWSTNTNNETEYSKTKHIHSNLTLTSGPRQLSLQSSPTGDGLPLSLKLTEFPITTLTKAVTEDTTMTTGIINGMAQLISMEPLRFSADLRIDSLKAYNTEVGNLTLKAENEPGIGYNAKVNIEGSENNITINASYSDNGQLNGNLDIRKFSLKTLDPFLAPIINGLQGNINGNVEFKGSLDEPVLTGQINATDVQGSYREYNTFFRIPEEHIVLTKQGIDLNDFNIYDSTGNQANVNGLIRTSDYRNYNYDLHVKTDHFMALNKKSTPLQEYYGPAYFTSDLRITSQANVLDVKGSVKVDENSEINVEMNNVDTTIASNNGIIIFVDSLQLADSAVLEAIKTEVQNHATSMKIGLALNLEMTKTSKLNIYLDKSGGDYMKVAGDANLTITQQPGGQMDMQGRFTIDNGEYQMFLSRIIKRKFIVQKGSSIQWNGSPTDADIDLTALYNVETTAEAILAGSQITNKGAYKQNLPFEVYLYLKKKLMKPEISFKLDMPVKEQNAFSGVVYTRIKQLNLDESELNKQVMGLLFINQFIPQDPLGSNSSSESFALFDYESAARSTAGSIISSQLNSLIASKIKAVDLDFQLESKADYTTGVKTNATDLTVNMRRSMWNDRYTVSVGSTFALEGSEEHKRNASGLAGNYSAEYKITKDGRYRAKAYRKDQYEADNSGQVVQTGISLILFLDFNKYRDILKKSKR